MAESQANQSVLTVKKYILDNGFTVYLNEDHTISKIYGTIVAKAGAKYDPEDAKGISH